MVTRGHRHVRGCFRGRQQVDVERRNEADQICLGTSPRPQIKSPALVAVIHVAVVASSTKCLNFASNRCCCCCCCCCSYCYCLAEREPCCRFLVAWGGGERKRERERKTIQLGMQERNFFMQSDKRSFNNFFPIDTSSSPCLRSAILPFFSLLLVSTVSLFVPYLFSILVLSIPSLCLIFFYFWFYHLPLSAPSPFFSIFGFYHVPLCAISYSILSLYYVPLCALSFLF